MRTHNEIISLIKSSDWGTEDLRRRIISKYFSSISPTINSLQRNYGFGEKRIIGIGCSYGQSLLYWGKIVPVLILVKIWPVYPKL